MREGDGTALAATVRTSNASYRSLFTHSVHGRIYLRGKAIYSRGRFVIVFLAIDAQGDCCSGATASTRHQLIAFAGVSTRKCAIGGLADPPTAHQRRWSIDASRETPVWHGYYNWRERNSPLCAQRFLNDAVTTVATGV